ncbi:ABC transporter permease [bacterium]|nr:ABC transporter permease [bacterium]
MDRQEKQPLVSFFWGIPAFVWQVVFFYLPLTFLLATSFVRYSEQIDQAQFTLMHYASLFKSVYITIFLRSLLAATSTVIVTLLIAYPVAYYLVLRMRRWRMVFFALLVLPFWTNFLLLVYSWYFLLENDGIINNFLKMIGLINEPIALMNSPIALYCGMFYCYLPFMLLPLYSTFDRLSKQLLEASQDLGANPTQTFWRITLPLTMSGIQTGAMLVFIPAFGEFVIPALLGGDKNMYVGSVITHYFLTIRDVSLGSAFTCSSVVILVTGFLFLFGIKKLLFGRRNYV